MEQQQQRFYWGFSNIYGNTVYDRTTQTPAFEFGASCDMSEYYCVKLMHRLNSLARSDKLDAARYRADEGSGR